MILQVPSIQTWTSAPTSLDSKESSQPYIFSKRMDPKDSSSQPTLDYANPQISNPKLGFKIHWHPTPPKKKNKSRFQLNSQKKKNVFKNSSLSTRGKKGGGEQTFARASLVTLILSSLMDINFLCASLIDRATHVTKGICKIITITPATMAQPTTQWRKTKVMMIWYGPLHRVCIYVMASCKRCESTAIKFTISPEVRCSPSSLPPKNTRAFWNAKTVRVGRQVSGTGSWKGLRRLYFWGYPLQFTATT